MTRILLALLAAALFAIAPVFGRDFTAEEKAGLEAAVNEFNTAFAQRDWAAVMSVVPPKILERIASENGVPLEGLEEQMVALMEQSLEVVTIESAEMPLEDATYGEGSDGTPYALIPTRTVIGMGEMGKVKSSNTTIAFNDGGEWYLVRGDDQTTLTIFREVYPAFSGIELPESTSEIVTE